jgi:hypothetical protein
VLYHFVRIYVGHEEYYVLSKIRDAGFDYSGRSNKLAHHVALRRDELVEIGPAEVLYHWDAIFPWTENRVGYLEERRIAFNGLITPAFEVRGGVVTDPGWVEYFAATTASLPPQQSLSFIYPAGWQPLELIRQIWSRLPAGSRWELTFSTWSPLLPGHISCNLRFVCDGTSEAGDLRRNAQILFWDLTAPLGQAPEPLKTGGGPNISSEPVCDLRMGFSTDLKPSRPTGFTLEEPAAQSVFRTGRPLPPTSYQDAVRGGHRNVVPPVVPTDSPTAIPVGTGDVPLPGMVLPPADTIAPPAAEAPMDPSSGSIWFYTSVLVAPTLAVVLGVLAWALVSSRPDSERTVAKGDSASSASTKQNNLPEGSGQQGPESQKFYATKQIAQDNSNQVAQSGGSQIRPRNQEGSPTVTPDVTGGKQSAGNSQGSEGSTGSQQNEHSKPKRSEENGRGQNRPETNSESKSSDFQGKNKNEDSEGNAGKTEASSSKTASPSEDNNKDSTPTSPPTDSSAPKESSPTKDPERGDGPVAEDSFTWFGKIPDGEKAIDKRIVSPPENPSKVERFDRLFDGYNSQGKKSGLVVDLRSKSPLRELDGNLVQRSDLESVRRGNAILCVYNYFEQRGEEKLLWFGLIVPEGYLRPVDDRLSILDPTSEPFNDSTWRSGPLPNYKSLFRELSEKVEINTRLLARGPRKLIGEPDGDTLTLEYGGHKRLISVHKDETQIYIEFKRSPNMGEEQQSTGNSAGKATNSNEEFENLLRQCTFYLYVEFKWKEYKSAQDSHPTDKATWFAVPFTWGGN